MRDSPTRAAKLTWLPLLKMVPLMKKRSRTMPVFALDESVDWDDLENALEASAEYQSSQRGVILPLFAFAPMTEPANLDQWEPMKSVPQDLFLVSVERRIDARVLEALEKAAPLLGPVVRAEAAAPVRIDLTLPLADIYRQMAEAAVAAFAETRLGKDDPSFFFLRGAEAVRVFDRELRKIS